ncbi:MAG TPA: histidine phosphatase family protein [Isosphaeraceae bacterium]|nr:histidine phosphatase family protein [Isosphaeraceae bacterium]
MDSSRRADGPRPETRILLIRHGETSAPERFHGAESDVGLSVRGVRQAEALARHLAELRPAAVCSSCMRRALHTGRPIAEACGVEIEVIEGLYERRMGALSGMLKTEGWDRYADEKSRWMAGDLDFASEDAEPYAAARERGVRALSEIVKRWPGQTIVVVAHGVLIKMVLATLLDDLGPGDYDEIGIDNAAINDLRWDGSQWRAVALNHRVEPSG